jgi:NAD-dependent SIR2 family protein deacetylase
MECALLFLTVFTFKVTPKEFLYKCHCKIKTECYASVLKMEMIHFSEMLVTTYKATRRHNPEDQSIIIIIINISGTVSPCKDLGRLTPEVS